MREIYCPPPYGLGQVLKPIHKSFWKNSEIEQAVPVENTIPGIAMLCSSEIENLSPSCFV